MQAPAPHRIAPSRAGPGPAVNGDRAHGVTQVAQATVKHKPIAVRNGKLSLNDDADIQAQWLKDPTGFITSADAKFSTLLKP